MNCAKLHRQHGAAQECQEGLDRARHADGSTAFTPSCNQLLETAGLGGGLTVEGMDRFTITHTGNSTQYVPICAADASFPNKAVKSSSPNGQRVSAGKTTFTSTLKHCIDFSKDFKSYVGSNKRMGSESKLHPKNSLA